MRTRIVQIVVVAGLTMGSTVALAYNWGVGIPGATGSYRIETGSFSAAQEDEIDLGAAAWNAGSSEILRGADFTWSRGTDVATASLDNCRNEVYMRDGSWFDSHGWSGYLAYTSTHVFCPDTDIIFNSSYSWCTERPTNCDTGVSIGQTAAHEFGHRIGFQHEDDNVALMNYSYPNGGDLGGAKFRINEDDYVGLVDHKTDSSTGLDLLLNRFGFDAGSSDPDDSHSWEVWDDDAGTYIFDKSDDDFPGVDPAPIQAIIEGTSTASPVIEWRLSADSACFSGTEYAIGTRTPTIGSNVPYEVGPTAWNMTGSAPNGNYYLCARIDSNTAITETSETDNTVRSDNAMVTVRS